MHTRFESLEVEQAWVAQSNEHGPTVAIFGGVHGDEQTGIEIVKGLVEHGINIEVGRVIVALGNLAAIQTNTRHTGTNLNRVFKELTSEELDRLPALPYEYRRAQELITLLHDEDGEPDGLLDLHDFTDPEGPIFLITEPRGFEIARAIGAPVISSGWSSAEPGGSDYYMETRQKIGLCYELGDKSKPKANLARGKGAVDRYLEYMGLREVVSEPMYEDPRFIRNDRSVYMLPGDFEFTRKFSTFDTLQEGELIARNGQVEHYAEKDQVIIFPFVNKPKIGEEAFCLGHEFSPAVK